MTIPRVPFFVHLAVKASATQLFFSFTPAKLPSLEIFWLSVCEKIFLGKDLHSLEQLMQIFL